MKFTRNKFKNSRTVVDGISFDSKKEAKYYLYLKTLLEKNEILNLQMQVKYELIPAIYEDKIIQLKTKTKVVKRLVQRPIFYVADFVFTNNVTNEVEVVDTKGFRTKEYQLKKKMMRALKGITIKEV